MRAFVTGANGLLGSTLCRVLLGEGWSVAGLVRPGSNRRALEGLDVELVEGDVRQEDAMTRGATGADVLFHVAAVFSYYGYSKDEMYRTAEQGSIVAVDAAKKAGVSRIVLTSSTTVLGWTETPTTVDESADLTGEAPDYFVTKKIQEQILLGRAKEVGVEAVACNPSLFIGPNDWRGTESLATVTSYLADPMKLTFGGGANVAHAEDIARGHLLIASRGVPGERYILSSPDNWEWKQIHRTISELCGIGGPRLSVPRSAGILGASLMELGAKVTGGKPMATRSLAKMAGRYFWYDGSKAEALGYRARGSRDTLAQTIAWLLDSPHLAPSIRRKLSPGEEVTSALRV